MLCTHKREPDLANMAEKISRFVKNLYFLATEWQKGMQGWGKMKIYGQNNYPCTNFTCNFTIAQLFPTAALTSTLTPKSPSKSPSPSPSHARYEYKGNHRSTI